MNKLELSQSLGLTVDVADYADPFGRHPYKSESLRKVLMTLRAGEAIIYRQVAFIPKEPTESDINEMVASKLREAWGITDSGPVDMYPEHYYAGSDEYS